MNATDKETYIRKSDLMARFAKRERRKGAASLTWSDAVEIAASMRAEPMQPVTVGRWERNPKEDDRRGKAYRCSNCGSGWRGSPLPVFCRDCGLLLRPDEWKRRNMKWTDR